MRHQRNVAFALAVLIGSATSVVGISGLLGVGPLAGAESQSAEVEAERGIDWDSPLPGGVEVATPAEAISALGYQAGIGTPERILITDPDSFDPTSRVAVFVYEDATSGRFLVMVQPRQLSEGDFEEAVSRVDGIGPTQLAIVTIRGDTKALLAEGPVATTLEWLTEDATMVVMGPSDSFTAEEAMAVANGI